MRTTLRSLCVGLALSLSACAAAPRGGAGLSADPAPAFRVTDQHGKAWTQASGDGRPLLVDFWATWCAPCVQALPDLQRFADAHGRRVQVLGLSTDQQGWTVVSPLLRRLKIDYPVAVIPPSLSGAYGVQAYPNLALIAEGKVVKRLSGRQSLDDLETALAPWLR